MFTKTLLLSSSIIGNEEQMTAYELHIAVKDYCFGRDDRLIGVSVMQLRDIMDQVWHGKYFNIRIENISMSIKE